MRRADIVKIKSDERILGDSDFVDAVLRGAEEDVARKERYRRTGLNFDEALGLAAQVFEIAAREIVSASKQPLRVRARSLLCYWAVRELGLSATAVAARLGLTRPAVSRSVQRGEKLAAEEGCQLEKMRKA
jgi:chromosomal replication initiation ATPase DnaA